jgi:hypothetical protein
MINKMLLGLVLFIALWSLYELYKMLKSDNFASVRNRRRHPKKRHTKKKPVRKSTDPVNNPLNEKEDNDYEDDSEDEQEDCGECEACPAVPHCTCDYKTQCKLLRHSNNNNDDPENGDIWALANNGTIYKSDCVNNVCNWDKVPGILNSLDQNNRELWGLTKKGTIFKCEKPCTGNWVSIPGNLDKLSVGRNHLWGVKGSKIKSDGTVEAGVMYSCVNTPDSPCTGNWKFVENDNMNASGINNVSI